MNIFHLDKSPYIAAMWLCDKHVPKMILETAQMLSTAHHYHNSPYAADVYKAAYVHHPMTQWVWASGNNYQWAFAHYMYLCDEFNARGFKGGVDHASKRLSIYLEYLPPALESSFDLSDWMSSITPPPLCMPEVYHRDCHVDAYRAYYKGDKSSFAVWERGSPAPSWWEEMPCAVA